MTQLRVLSLGAGVQSTTLALMAAHGEIEPPHCAIFADTGWEPRAVYDHLDWQ
jgi:3'-phosphoadenosine 5'-phosphosulfate sulfotransferase (PAPS reductase)/FAD synthetase